MQPIQHTEYLKIWPTPAEERYGALRDLRRTTAFIIDARPFDERKKELDSTYMATNVVSWNIIYIPA